MDIAPERITAGILAGGRGRRLGGVDKGWYEIDGMPLIEHTLARVASQCAQIMISANRTLARYRALGYPVHPDDSDDYEGPLAGVANILRAAKTPYVLIVPVDTPRLPQDLAERLAKGMGQATQIAVARCDDQVHALHALLRRDVLDDLEAALFAGTRVVREWEDGLDRVIVDWSSCEGFANINTAEDAEAITDSR